MRSCCCLSVALLAQAAPLLGSTCSADAAAIYSVVITELRSAQPAEAARLLLPARTTTKGHTPGVARWIRKNLSPELTRATLNSYENAASQTLTSCALSLAMKPAFYEAGLDHENLVQPGVLFVELSQIGYSEDGTQALLYGAFAWEDWSEGYGHYMLLQRTPLGWTVVKRLRAWGPKRVRVY
jgi:hypothetical protein